MTLGIGLLCLLAGGAAIFTVAALLRWLTMSVGAKTGSVWDWFWGLLDIPGHVAVNAFPERASTWARSR
jgi:hypothetical protein